MYNWPTKLKQLYNQIGAKNKYPKKEANQISLIYLVPQSPQGVRDRTHWTTLFTVWDLDTLGTLHHLLFLKHIAH